MKTALILPGGGAKGAIELGACKVIFQKIKPDLIIGTSVGALNGAALADTDDIDANLKKMEMFWLKVKKSTFFPLNWEVFYKFLHASSIYSSRGIYRFLNEYLSVRKFADLKIPLYVNCTNLISGQSEFFSEGELIDPLVASASAAPLLPPVIIDNVPYVDGAFGSVFGVEKALELKCKRLVIVAVEHFEHYNMKFKTFREHAEYSWALMRNQNMRNELQICKDHNIQVIEIKPVTPTVEILTIKSGDTKKMIEAGEEEAKRVLG